RRPSDLLDPETDFLKLCGPVSKDASKEVWNNTGSVGSKKNRTFKPKFKSCEECKGTPASKRASGDQACQQGVFRDTAAKGRGLSRLGLRLDQKTLADWARKETARMLRGPKF